MTTNRLKQYANELRNDVRYGVRRWAARRDMPDLLESDRKIVDELRQTGAHVTSLDALKLPGSAGILAAGDRVTAGLGKRAVANGQFTISATADEVGACPELIRWGLHDRLLSIVINYIGLPIAYRGLTVRRDIVGGPRTETRMWHRDNEDSRIVKIIVYLNDIGADDGPFEFVPRGLTPPSWRVPLVDTSRVTDAEMARLTKHDSWHPCIGARGTAVFVDTCRVFHRGRIAEHEDRRTLFYCYNSRRPLNPQWCAPLFDTVAFAASASDLSDAQRDAIAAIG